MYLGIDIGTQSVKALMYDAEQSRVPCATWQQRTASPNNAAASKNGTRMSSISTCDFKSGPTSVRGWQGFE
jgi:ribulose kinase